MKTITRPQFPNSAPAALGPNPVSSHVKTDFGGAPVIFSAQQLNLLPGITYNLPTKTLQPGFRTPYWIDEIRFDVNAQFTAGVFPLANFIGLLGLLEVKFRTGRYSFSRDSIPLGLLAPRFSYADVGFVANGDGGTKKRAFASVRWHLPKPLFMPAGDAVECIINYASYASTNSANLGIDAVNVAYMGRLDSPGKQPPPVRYVPWLARYRAQLSELYQGTTDQFRNPFTKTLNVQRFTERTYFESTFNSGVTVNSFRETTQFQSDSTTEPYATVKLDGSDGYFIVSQPTPVNDVFDGARGAWTFARTLGPREQFNLQVATQQAATLASLGSTTEIWTQFGLVGYREEKV